jgi:hypothetical protein
LIALAELQQSAESDLVLLQDIIDLRRFTQRP